MGSLVKCAGCGLRCGERPVGVYWRWMRADGVWKAYYHRICVGCYMARVAPLDVSYDDGRRLTCPACGVDTEDDYDGIYTTSFPGRGPAVSTESPFCDSCAVPIRVWVQEHARDTDIHDGAAQPRHESPTALDTLRDLGRVARAG